ncbi:glycoside hydrolase family 114 protein, partial [Lepidopterella palustris CBS 459.81]
TALPATLSSRGVWQPAVDSSWQIVLSQTIDTSGTASPNVEIFDVDMFTTDVSAISALKKQDKKVICYFSAGSYEPDRPDSGDFQPSDLGNTLDGWPQEKWLNLKSDNVKNIMVKRIQLAAAKGCDGIDPDNMDGYGNNNGLNLQPSDSIAFLNILSSAASSNNLAMGLKNSLEILPSVIDKIQFAVNEQCHANAECETYAPLTAKGKPVFNIEYPDSAPNVFSADRSKLCGTMGAAHMRTLLKMVDLGGWVEFCDGTTAETAI